MARKLIILPGFSNVGAGQVAIADISLGPSYAAILIGYKRGGAEATQAQINSDLTKIALKVNGKPKWELSATEHKVVQDRMGYTDQDGVRTLWLVDPKQSSQLGEDAMIWGTGDMSTFTLEITIDAAAPAPQLELVGVVIPRRQNLGAHRVIEVYNDNIAAAGEYLINKWPTRYRGRFLERIGFTGGAPSEIRLRVNQDTLFESKNKYAKSENTGQYAPYGVPAGYDWLEMTPSRRLGDVMNLDVQDFRIFHIATAAAALKGIVMMVEVPPGGQLAA